VLACFHLLKTLHRAPTIARADALGLDPDRCGLQRRALERGASTAQKIHRAAVAPGSRRRAPPGSAFPSAAAGSASRHAPGSAVPGDSSEWRAAGDASAAEEKRGPTVESVAADPTGPAAFSRSAADSREAPPVPDPTAGQEAAGGKAAEFYMLNAPQDYLREGDWFSILRGDLEGSLLA